MKTSHPLPFITERYVEAVYSPTTGQLDCWRVSVDIIPDRISSLKVGTKVAVTIDIPKAHKRKKARKSD